MNIITVTNKRPADQVNLATHSPVTEPAAVETEDSKKAKVEQPPTPPPDYANLFFRYLTHKRLANLIGDSYLLGMKDSKNAGLEGNEVCDSCAFLKVAFQFIYQKYPELQAWLDENQNFATFLKGLESIKNEGAALYQILANPNLVAALDAYIADLVQRISVATEPLLIPLGWEAKAGPGHFMVGLLLPKETGVQLVVINTGAGGQFHQNECDGAKTFQRVTRTYFIPKDMVEPILFWRHLIEPNLLTRDKNKNLIGLCRGFDENDLYVFLERYRCNQNAFTAEVESQLSGTCSFKALLALSLILLGPVKFKLLKHLIEYHAFETLLTADQKQPFLGKDHFIHLQKGLPNLFRQVKKLLDRQKLFPEPHEGLYARMIERLEQLQNILNQRIRAPRSLLGAFRMGNDPNIDTKALNERLIKELDGIDSKAMLRLMTEEAPGVPIKRNSSSALPVWLLDVKTVDAVHLVNTLASFAAWSDTNDCDEQEYLIELLLQLGRLFFHPDYASQKQAILKELKICRAHCERILQDLSKIYSQLKGPKGLPHVMLGTYSGLLAAYQIGCILEGHLGFQGDERLDHYFLDMSLFEVFFRNNSLVPPSLNYQLEIDAENLKKALGVRKNERLLMDFNDQWVREAFDYEKDRKDASVMQLGHLVGDFDYACAHAAKIHPVDWHLADAAYRAECDRTQEGVNVELSEWRATWWYLYLAHPHYRQLRTMALVAYNSCGLFLADGSSVNIDATCVLKMDEEEKKLTFVASFEVYTDDGNEGNEESCAQECFEHLSNHGSQFKPAWRNITLYQNGDEKGLFLGCNGLHQNLTILLSLPKYKELMSAQAVVGGLQIATLIHLFDKSPELFTSADARIVFWAVLFRRNELRLALQKNPEIAYQLVTLFEKAIGEYSFKATHRIEERSRLETIAFLHEQYVRCLVWFIGEKALPHAKAKLEGQRELLRKWISRSDASPSLQYYLHAILLDSYQLQFQLTKEEAVEFILCRFTLRALETHLRKTTHCFSTYFRSTAVVEERQMGAIKDLPHSLFNKILALHEIRTPPETTWSKSNGNTWVSSNGRYVIDPVETRVFCDDFPVDVSSLPTEYHWHRFLILAHLGLKESQDTLIKGTMKKQYYETEDAIGIARFSLDPKDPKSLVVCRRYQGRWFFCTGLPHNTHVAQGAFKKNQLLAWSNCSLWVNLDGSGESLLISHQDMKVAHHIDARGFFQGYRLQWMPKGLFGHFCPYTLLGQSEDESHLKLDFHNYRDEEGDPIIFIKREAEDRFASTKNSRSFISPNQELHGIRYFPHFLLLETDRGEKEVLIPHLFRFKGSNLYALENAIVWKFNLQNGALVPQAKCSHNLFLAHLLFQYAESAEDYLRVKEFLLSARIFRRFNEEELKLLLWFLNNQVSGPDHDPHAYALVLLATWIVRDNFTRYPKIYKVEKEDLAEKKPQMLPSAYSTTSEIVKFWDVVQLKGLDDERIAPLLQGYLKRRQNVHHELRLENLLTWEQWKYLGGQEEFQGDEGIYEQQERHSVARSNLSAVFAALEKAKSNAVQDFPPFLCRYTEEFPRHFHYLLELILTENLPQPLELRLKLQMEAMSRYVNSVVKSGEINLRKGLSDHHFTLAVFLTAVFEDLDSPLTKSLLQHLREPSPKNLEKVEMCFSGTLSNRTYITYLRSERNLLLTRVDAQYYPFERHEQLPAHCHEPDLCYRPHVSLYPGFSPSPAESHQDTFVEDYFAAAHPDLDRDYKEGFQKNQQYVSQSAKVRDIEAFKAYVRGQEVISAEMLRREILEMANRQLKTDLSLRTEVGGGKKSLLDLDTCIILFLHRDSQEFAKRTGIQDPQAIQQLFHTIGQYLEVSIRNHHNHQILDQITENRLGLIDEIHAKLQSEHSAARSDNPEALLVFEYYKGIVFRPQQVEKLEEMLRKVDGQYPDLFVQALQGEGKSFAWGPELALRKADGYHLSCMVYPTHLFPTALEEMSRGSARIFGQRAHALYFDDRGEHFTKEYLDSMERMLKGAIRNRDTIITTVETIRALRTKYIKMCMLLEDNPPQNEDTLDELNYCVSTLEDIMKLMRSRGLFTFDEVHEAMDPRKELNMPYGMVTHLDFGYCKLAGTILKLALKVKDPLSPNNPLLKLKQNQQDTLTAAQWIYLRNEVVNALLEDAEIKALLALPADCQAIKRYLTKKTEALPEQYHAMKQEGHIDTPCAADYAILAHQMLAENWLSDALSKGVFEHHGLANQPGAPPISIPFVANMKPAIGSEFSDPFVMMINTFIAYMVAGVNENQMRSFILHLRQVVLEEYLSRSANDPKAEIENAPTLLLFNKLMAQHQCRCDLLQCDLNNREMLLQVMRILNLKEDPAISLIIEYASRQAIQMFDLYTHVISSTGQDAATAAAHATGFSATLEHPLMAPVMDYRGRTVKMSFAPGTNGQTIDLLVRKNPQVYLVGDGPNGLFRDLMLQCSDEDKKRLHALIDIGCYFRGKFNYEVAQLLCEQLPKVNADLKGILYFDDKTSKLFCMHVATKAFVELPSLDIEEVCRLTKYRKEELFTYYDQDHITGTHIHQLADAIAIATFSDQTMLYKLLQGDRRMRLLDFYQRIFTAVPRSSILARGEKKPLIHDVVLSAHLKSAEMKERLNFLYGLQKLSNLVQQYLLDKCYANILTRATVFRECGMLFRRDITVNLYMQYALGKAEVDRKAYLQWVKEQLLKPLRPLTLPRGDFEILDQQLARIIEWTIEQGVQAKIEVPKQWETSTVGQTLPQNADGTMVQMRQQERTRLSEHEKDQENQDLDLWNSLSESDAAEIVDLTEREFFSPQFATVETPNIFPLKKFMNGAFDARIMVTRNFAYTCNSGASLFDSLRKPVHHFLLIHDENKEWRVLIGSMEDGAFFIRCLEQKERIPPKRQIWFLTTQLQPAWKSPFPYDRQKLLATPAAIPAIALVLFYSGDLAVLKEPWAIDTLGQWLKTKKPEERAVLKRFFETYILQNRLPTLYFTSGLSRIW